MPRRYCLGRNQMVREIVLLPRQTWSTLLRAGQCVTCYQGEVWLTLSDQANDWLLRAGQSWSAPHDGCAVVQAMEGSTAILSVEAP